MNFPTDTTSNKSLLPLISMALDIAGASSGGYGGRTPWAGMTGNESSNELAAKFISGMSAPGKPQSALIKSQEDIQANEDAFNQHRLAALQNQLQTGKTQDEITQFPETSRLNALKSKLGIKETETKLSNEEKTAQLDEELNRIYSDTTLKPDEKDQQAIEAFKRLQGGSVMKPMIIEMLKAKAMGGRETDFQRKLAYLRGAFPDASEAELYKMLANPSSQFGPSGEKLQGAFDIAQQEKLGSLTPQVIKKEAEKTGATTAASSAVESQKQQKIASTETNRLSDTEQGIKMLDNLVEKSPAFKTLSNSPLDVVRAINPWDEDVKSFNQLIAATRQVIGKGLEGGVLRKEDEAKYKNILPSLGEPLNLRTQKATQLRNLLVTKYNTDLENLGKASFNVEKFKPIENREYGQVNVPSTSEESFGSEKEARAAGKKSGDVTVLKGVGKVRLK